MLRIAVCDDESMVVDKIEYYINSYGRDNNIGFRITKFYDGEDLISDNGKFDLIFLDIEMKKLNGIKTAQHIRKYDMDVPIVYITSYTDYWRNAYEVHAFSFIEKNKLCGERVRKVLSDFIRLDKTNEISIIHLRTEHGALAQKENEIYYFLVDSKKSIVMYTEKEKLVIKENLKDIYDKLDKFMFYESHRSCILNLMYVYKYVGFDIIMKNGEFVPLSQRKGKEFRNLVNEFLHIK